MNVLLTPFAREEKIPDVLVGLRSYNSSDGFARAAGEQLNFAAPSEDEAEYPPGSYLKKGKQDPLSHRIIEKRRRDRMNNCLADLSRLIPPEYLKKGRGRVEKTEIIEMAIRHIKYLQERANAAERTGTGTFRAGFQEAVAEGIRFLVEIQGYSGDGLCAQLSTHLQRHIEIVTKGDNQHNIESRSHGSSTETNSSLGSSHGFAMKGVIAQAPPPAPPPFSEPYDGNDNFAMDCDRVQAPPPAPTEAEAMHDSELPLDGRQKHMSPKLRSVRKLDSDDYLHSYKFKNSIERRFSRSQDNECSREQATDLRPAHMKAFSHKRRRAVRPMVPSTPASTTTTSTSGAGSTEEARDTSPQDTSSESPHHHQYDKPPPPSDVVPVFALNTIGKYYVPLNVDHACLVRLNAGAFEALDSRAVQLSAPLHPVTIHVNFQPCLNYHHVKREPSERDWRQ